MAIHAETATRIIVVIMMAIDAIHDRVVKVRECHRQYRFRTFEEMAPDRFVFDERRTECDNQRHQEDTENEYRFHNGKFRTAANAAVNMTLSTR